MYCPKCGHQQVSLELRFCSRCGFKLDTVKASLADDASARGGPENSATVDLSPHHRSINLGIILMFFGALITSWIVTITDFDVRPLGAFLILAASLLLILLCSRHLLKAIYRLLSWEEAPTGSISARQGEIRFGAILMFIGAVLAGLAMIPVRGSMELPVFFLVLQTLFLLLLITSHRLMRGVQNLLSAEAAPKNAARSNVTTDLRRTSS